MTDKAYGSRASEAAERHAEALTPNVAGQRLIRDAVRRAHDHRVLGLDASICIRDVIELLGGAAVTKYDQYDNARRLLIRTFGGGE